MSRLSSLGAVAVLALAGGAADQPSASVTVPSRAMPTLAVSVLDPAASANEIELLTPNGRRVRIDPHPPLPLDGAWSPDGREIAFSGSGDNEARGIYVMNAGGTRVRLLFTPRGQPYFGFEPSWAPDGRSLAFVDGRALRIMPADGDRPRRLTDADIAAYSAPIAWSPDGRTLAFGSGDDGALYTIGTDGTRLRRLTRKLPELAVDLGAQFASAAWSPDGRRIAFVHYPAGAPRNGQRPITDRRTLIEVVPASGGRERSLARGDLPAWSPDGLRLAFITAAGIGVVSPDGGRPRLIAKARGSVVSLAWSADGTRVVFASWPSRRLYVADATRGGVRPPSAAERTHLRVVPDADQHWSADGNFLAAEGWFRQRSADPVGAEPAHGDAIVRILTPSGVAATFRWSTDDDPVWAPDGGRLAFVRTARTTTIYVIGARGGHARPLVLGRTPVWSPDGASIAFERDGAIFVVRAAGGRARQIATGYDPAWSPDGRMLAFDTWSYLTGGSGGAFVVPAAGGEPRRFAVAASTPCGEQGPRLPAWSHDGRSIAFDEGFDVDCPSVDTVASDGTSLTRVAVGYEPQWTPSDSEIVFIDDNSDLFPASQQLAAVSADGRIQRTISDHADVVSFSITADGEFVAYNRFTWGCSPCASEIWITRMDGRARWPVFRGSTDFDPAWRPG